MSELRESCFALGYEYKGEGEAVIDFLIKVDRENSTVYYQDLQEVREGSQYMLVNPEYFLKENYTTVGGDRSVDIVGAEIEGRNTFVGLKVKECRRNTMFRLNYVQEDEVDKMIYFKVGIKVEELEQEEDIRVSYSVQSVLDLETLYSLELGEDMLREILDNFGETILDEMYILESAVKGTTPQLVEGKKEK